MKEDAKKLQNLLTEAGYKTLAAGGFVRDYLIKRPYKDIDLATEALPEQVIEVMKQNNIKTIETGLKHGTITAVLNGENYEITTLRVDKNCDGRHADVEFTKSFEEDAKRRDFTINALFMDLNTMEVLDYVKGQKDIKNKVIRFVGDPHERIHEDYLRILRFFRFRATHGGHLVADRTKINDYYSYLVYVSPERIREELLKLIVGDHASHIFYFHYDLIGTILPELDIVDEVPGLYGRINDGIEELAKHKDPIVSFAYLFKDIGKPLDDQISDYEIESEKVASRVCDRLSFSSQDKTKIKFLIRNSRRLNHEMTSPDWRRLINDCAEFRDKRIVYDLVTMYVADQGDNCEKVRKQSMAAMYDFPETKIESPLSGDEIMEKCKIQAGIVVGTIRKALKENVITGKLSPEDKEKAYKLMEETWRKIQDEQRKKTS